MLFVMYGNSIFSSVLLSLREVRWVYMMCICFGIGFGIGMMLLVSMYEG